MAFQRGSWGTGGRQSRFWIALDSSGNGCLEEHDQNRFFQLQTYKGNNKNNAYGMVISEFVTKSHFSQLKKYTFGDLESHIGILEA